MEADQLTLLADLILLLHFAIVAFVVLGLPVIWLGYWRGWGWVRNPWMRWGHLGLMGFIAAQTVVGQICPLTVWENRLRLAAGQSAPYESTFIERWFGRILFYDADPGVFVALYFVFFLLVMHAWIVVRPDRRNSVSP